MRVHTFNHIHGVMEPPLFLQRVSLDSVVSNLCHIICHTILLMAELSAGKETEKTFFNSKVLKPTSCQYIIALRLNNTLVLMYSCFFISFLYSEDGQVLSKKALKKQAKQAKKDERKANVASKLVREIKREKTLS